MYALNARNPKNNLYLKDANQCPDRSKRSEQATNRRMKNECQIYSPSLSHSAPSLQLWSNGVPTKMVVSVPLGAILVGVRTLYVGIKAISQSRETKMDEISPNISYDGFE